MNRLVPACAILLAACGQTTTTTATAVRSYSSAGAVATTAADESCKGKESPTADPAACGADSDASGGMGGMDAMDHMSGADAGSATDTTPTGGEEESAVTRKGSEADDDDCKYHVKWLASGHTVGEEIYFQVDATELVNGKALGHLVETPTPVYVEALIDAGDPAKNHAAPASGQTCSDGDAPGRYLVGPVKFDQAAQWTVRFHFFGACEDGETSPHSHVAFLFDVVTPTGAP